MATLALTAAQHTLRAGLTALVSRQISNLFAPDMEGPRLETLQLQTSTAGSPMPIVFGRMRLSGQVIWAARFTEIAETQSAGGKGGGPTVTNYAYSASFAVALCEGEIGRIGRIWANGEELDTSNVLWRWYSGSQDQLPDSLIEAVEGAASAPAYRGTAYVVFEDLPLEDYGNRLPNLSFEVMASSQSDQLLELTTKGVCLIPASGEFAYADEPVMRSIGLAQDTPENVHTRRATSDLEASLDDLETALPNCQSVALVTAWFGTDLRCAHCDIRPGVENRDKQTRPLVWQAAGETRASAWLVSEVDGAPAYGGTPSDQTVIAAIQALKARGYEVTLYPFILMDIPTGNSLPDPYGGAEQAVYPWRGRMTCHPAPGQPGSPDQSASAATQISDFFGTASASDFSVSGEMISYSGPGEWGFNRFILHHAALAKAAGGVEAFLIGSEMRGLTTVRDGAVSYPAVTELIALTSEVRSLLGSGVKLSYAADWSEYFGHQPEDGSGDRLFHLDPLWSDPEIDFIGIDWYAPLSDWRDGNAHLDAQTGVTQNHDLDYLKSSVEGGEGYDWYYASQADRDSQIRTPISDGTYSEPWVFRYKDIRNWWSQPHHNRPGGIRDGSPTGWTPESKPVRLIEYGCPAVDKGSNQPNVFIDAKSSESAAPHYSNRTRDDLIQRRYSEALVTYWQDNNPVSSVYAGPMIDLDHSQVWTWDARPFPEFPALDQVWSDSVNWRLGHWLTGRAGQSSLARIVSDIATRAGLGSLDVTALEGVVTGYVLDRPRAARDYLADLAGVFGFDVIDRADGPACVPRNLVTSSAIVSDQLAREDNEPVIAYSHIPEESLPSRVRITFLEDSETYEPASAYAQNLDIADPYAFDLSLGWVSDQESVARLAGLILTDIRARKDSLTLSLPPSLAAFEPGDVLNLDKGRDGASWRIESSDGLNIRRAGLESVQTRPSILSGSEPRLGDDDVLPSRPQVIALDLPLSPTEGDRRNGLILAAQALPWPGDLVVYAGLNTDTLTQRAIITRSTPLGVLNADLPAAPEGRWDRANIIDIELNAGVLSSADRLNVLGGINRLTVQNADGWEVIQYQTASLTGSNIWRLSTLLRGLGGSPIRPVSAGASVVILQSDMTILPIGDNEREADLALKVVPQGRPLNDISALDQTVTYLGIDLKPLSPVHLKEESGVSGREFSWIRRTRQGGDAWVSGTVPLSEAEELYQFDLLDSGGSVVLSETVASPSYVLDSATEAVLYPGGTTGALWRVAQLSDRFGPGQAASSPLKN